MESSVPPRHQSWQKMPIAAQELKNAEYVTVDNNESCESIAQKFGLDAEAIFAVNKKYYRGFKTVKTRLKPGTLIMLRVKNKNQ